MSIHFLTVCPTQGFTTTIFFKFNTVESINSLSFFNSHFVEHYRLEQGCFITILDNEQMVD